MKKIKMRITALIAFLCLTSCSGAGGADTTITDGTSQTKQTTEQKDTFPPEETVPDDPAPDEEFSSERTYIDIKTPRLIQFNYSSADFAA